MICSDGICGDKKPVSQGFSRAQHRLVLQYYRGKGVTKDYTEAYAWLSLAAAQGNNEAKANPDMAKRHMPLNKSQWRKRTPRHGKLCPLSTSRTGTQTQRSPIANYTVRNDLVRDKWRFGGGKQ